MDLLKKGLKHFTDKVYDKALNVFLTIESTEPIASYHLGLIYRKGLGVDENQKEAFKWFLKSAESGNVEAQYVVGCSYIFNPGFAGTPLDKTENDKETQKMKEDPFYVPFDTTLGVGVEPNINEAFKWLLEALKNGHYQAEIELDDLYESEVKNHVEILNQDMIELLIIHYKEKYKEGHIDVINIIGELYENKNGNSHHYNEAIKWYLIGANNHLSYSQYRLGHLNRLGLGTDVDISKSIKWFKSSIQNGYDQHDPWVYTCLGKIYSNLEGEVNQKEAIKWLILGANFYDTESEVMLKRFYDKGYDVSEKYHKKFALLNNALIGDIQSQRLFIDQYVLNSGGYTWNAYDWLKKEDDNGNQNAKDQLMDIFGYRYGSYERDQITINLANSGNEEEQFNLAEMYKSGSHVEQNNELAIYWYKKASEKHVIAAIDLGYYYAHGVLGEIDYLEAYHNYQHAMTIVKDIYELRKINLNKLRYNIGNDKAELKALSGDVNAQLYMGCLYQHGFEINRSIVKSIYWYEMASKQGNEQAKMQLISLYEKQDKGL